MSQKRLDTKKDENLADSTQKKVKDETKHRK